MFEVLISSCDKYSYLWNSLEFSHKHYFWDDYKTTLISETKKSDYFNTKSYQGSWRDMVLAALKEMDSEYVLYLQDDYMFYKCHVPITFFNDLVLLCKERSIDHLLIINPHEIYHAKYVESDRWGDLYKREFTGSYFASLQMGIWRREYFIKILESFNPATIWDFELGANKYCKSFDAKLYLYHINERRFEPEGIIYKGGLQPIQHVIDKWKIDYPDKISEIELIFKNLIIHLQNGNLYK